MPAERDDGRQGGELPEEFLRLPGVLALRVTVQPAAAGAAWCAGAWVVPGAPPVQVAPRPAAGAAARDTCALDALFTRGL
jgi:hypothetical protein